MTTSILEKDTEPILLDGFTWREFKVVEQLLDRPGVRLSFLDGILEIRKMPGRKHETVKKRIAALVEACLEFLELDFVPTGSMTLESEEGLVRRQADESYELGLNRERPDLAIEIVITSGGINKLEAYKRLQIPEVWFWEKEKLSLYQLQADGYVEIQQSQVLPTLDIALLTQCVNMTNHADAVREFRRGLQSESKT
ncbi:MAG: Uma2 family endonuclease [Leptolyngbyaceae cyanobacterium RM1_405_57]|nr:Uma2 family endonuclease [Leptolyngbyaceae cyanobacterium RM1_405_57]